MKLKITSIFAVVLIAWLVSGCGHSATPMQDGAVVVRDGGGACTVQIIEIDGYRFAVAVGYQKCGITQIRD